MPNAPGTVLTLNQLRLRYPGSESWTLDGLDLSLKSGDRLALVGPSGCGKSTVARAALQLLPPGSSCEGDLLLNGQDPRQLSRPALRALRGEAVGLVFSRPDDSAQSTDDGGWPPPRHLRRSPASHGASRAERPR